MMIRDAGPGDLPAILAIYNDAVARTTAIWNEAPADLANRADWLAGRQQAGYPVLVADRAGTVLGYASFGPFRPFSGYRHTVEHSVYVAPAHAGGGIGRALMEALITHARAAGHHVMVAGIEAGNLPSIRLHEKLGFRQTGLLPQVGAKFGQWLDLAFMQLTLDTRDTPDGPG
ncbi:MAG: GNAT family N-acetyltransferase [Paracoccus sp. (in: a-proteobacteria)]|nr:GNAT family N-acetyltransferase [Paracoccus sp. (in: a-proteobacteria)]